MSPRSFKAIAAGALAITLSIVAQGAEPQASCKSCDLRCEMQTGPIGVDEVKPRLSWKLDDTRRGARQTAYRILAASSTDKLAADQGDLWDSGKVVSEQSHQVEYGGKPLISGHIVHWKVKMWDKDGAEGPWSAPAHWDMGMLKPEDWKAQWLAPDATPINNDDTEEWLRYVIVNNPEKVQDDVRAFMRNNVAPVVLGKDFVLEQVPERARVYVSARGFYALYLNGQRISDEERNHVPLTSGVFKTSFYDTYDVTPLLRKGENRLRCLLWHGYWQINQYGKDANKQVVNLTKFFLQLNGSTREQTDTLVVTDDTWRQTTGPILKSAASPNSMFREGEVYDARIPDPCRGETPITTAAWTPVKTTTGLSLRWRFFPPERVIC